MWVLRGDITPVLHHNALSDLLDGDAQDEDLSIRPQRSVQNRACGQPARCVALWRDTAPERGMAAV